MSDPDVEPFKLAAQFTYEPAWTGRIFGLIRVLIRVMAIDCHPELREAWRAIIANGGPEQLPDAMASFGKLPFPHHDAEAIAAELRDPMKQILLTRAWADFFRAAYREARDLAQTARRNAAVCPGGPAAATRAPTAGACAASERRTPTSFQHAFESFGIFDFIDSIDPFSLSPAANGATSQTCSPSSTDGTWTLNRIHTSAWCSIR
jgi:hypothetical protein